MVLLEIYNTQPFPFPPWIVLGYLVDRPPHFVVNGVDCDSSGRRAVQPLAMNIFPGRLTIVASRGRKIPSLVSRWYVPPPAELDIVGPDGCTSIAIESAAAAWRP
jgi:hypothetical protein